MGNTAELYTGYSWYGMLALALVLFVIYALLAGLTLALCGLEMPWLQMKCSTGNARQRKQARAVLRLAKHRTWMLCKFVSTTCFQPN